MLLLIPLRTPYLFVFAQILVSYVVSAGEVVLRKSLYLIKHIMLSHSQSIPS